MKSLKKLRSTENRKARKAFIRRGHASTSSAALLAPDTILSGRTFRRANGLSRVEAAMIATALRPKHSSTGYSSVSLRIDDYHQVFHGLELSYSVGSTTGPAE